MKALLALLVCSFTLLRGQPFAIPFASKGNTVELSIENASSLTVENVRIEILNVPAWMHLTSQKEFIADLSGKAGKTVIFSFSIDRTAPVKRDQKLTILISTTNGQTWAKEITVSVAPPEQFELFQNYPNPFNPATTIGYQLAADSRVSLRIYNLLGQEVAFLVEGERSAGYYQESWNGSSVASGMYVYQLVATAGDKRIVEQKSMLLLK